MLEEQNEATATIRVLEKAIDATQLRGLDKLLELVASTVDADGCVLWMAADPGDDPDNPFSPLAQWWKDTRFYSHDGMSHESLAGLATATRTLQHIPDIASASAATYDVAFVRRTGTHVICSVPLDIDGSRASALNFYRQRRQPFLDDELRRAERLANYVPSAFALLLQRISLPLLTSTEEILSRWTFDLAEPGRQSWPNQHLLACCQQVAAVFDCVEVSVFLEDPTFTPGEHVLAASTWPWDVSTLPRSYRKDEPRLTSSLIRSKQAFRVRDLADFERRPERMRRLYPGTRWSDSFNLKAHAREVFRLRGDDQPPLSFMAAPIVFGTGQMRGIIRCSTAKSAPYYFVEQQLDILKLVASQIGGAWHSWLTARDLAFQSEAWKSLAGGLRTLNKDPLKLIGSSANIDDLLNSCLKAAADAIPGAAILDVRLFDAKSGELYFAAHHGTPWNDPSQHAAGPPRAKRFAVPGESIGADVFRTRLGVFYSDVKREPAYVETFVNCRSLICVPILALDDCYGVLDVRSQEPHPLHERSLQSATVLAYHIALYVRLKQTIDELLQARANIQEMQRQQAEAYHTLAHQLRSPIDVALGRATKATAFRLPRHLQLAERDRLAVDRHISNLREVRGLLVRTQRVAENTGLYSALAAGRTPPSRREPIDPDLFLQRVGLLARDAVIESDHRLRIELDIPTFVELHRVEIDPGLFEQAIANLLENAAKYGFRGSLVRVSWANDTTTAALNVDSDGLMMSDEDVRRCTEKYYRGKEAKRVFVGEGGGIGLWMVDQIMAAHGGELCVATGGPDGDDRHHTTVTLKLRRS